MRVFSWKVVVAASCLLNFCALGLSARVEAGSIDPPVLGLEVTPHREANFAYEGEVIRFDASTSYDPDSESALSFYWYVNDVLTESEQVFEWTPELDAGSRQEIKIKIIDTEGLYTEDVRVYSIYPISKRFYYLKDHLGSVRATIDEYANVVHYSDYYPFGMQMPGRVLENESPDERFTGHELDAETGWVYAGARYYDPEVARWNRPDPRADEYPGWSGYNYALNNPVNGFDPDGNYVVFINGWYLASIPFVGPNLADKWGEFGAYVRGYYHGEEASYIDGSMGGGYNSTQVLRAFKGTWNISSMDRYETGYARGRLDAADIESKLKKGETVKIFSHSMGGAYGAGFAAALRDAGLDVEFHLAIAPFQSGSIPASDVTTFQVGDPRDWISGEPDIDKAIPLEKGENQSSWYWGYKVLLNFANRHLLEDFDAATTLRQIEAIIDPENQRKN